VEELTMRLYLAHGTTMAGLVAAGHSIDYDHFHEKVRVGPTRRARGGVGQRQGEL
jgi:hypothetical protein